jgi:hypothetical protein
MRRIGATERPLGSFIALVCGLVSGYLLWIHPKLTVVAAFFGVLGLVRPDTSRRSRFAFGMGFFLTAFTSLLYCHHLSGLFRPEGLYIRQAEEYVGSPNPFSLRFAAGLVKALLGARDGLFIFAPILTLGFLALREWKRPSRSTIELWCLFAVVWLTSAVHDGASLGSPARLMAPVAFVPALFLARLLREQTSSSLKATAILLFAFGGLITNAIQSDWRRNVNPYRTMFTNPATNFESNLPGNSFSDEAYVVDFEKAGFILVTFVILAALLTRPTAKDSDPLAPARFGGAVLATLVVMACGLNWLGPP